MLPGVRPSHTRPGFFSGSRLYVENYAPTAEDFIQLDSGLWLLPSVIAEKDHRAAQAKLTVALERQQAEDMETHAKKTKETLRILGKTAITDIGCMVGGLRWNQSADKWALQLAEYEHGGVILTDLEDMQHVKTCGDPDCYNTRHYELDYGKPTTLFRRQHELNPNWFTTAENGSIVTVWGDKLPSVKQSLEYFIKFQYKNYPFVPIRRPKGERGPTSRLTATPMAQIRFHPVTGCWESWKYYSMRESDITKNGRFDGYGQMYKQFTVKEFDKTTGEVLKTVRRGGAIAHILIWEKTGHRLDPTKVLNHLCNYKRCCNPLHLRQETMGQNNSHGARVNKAMQAMIDENPEIEKQFLSAEELAPYHQTAREIYRELNAA